MSLTLEALFDTFEILPNKADGNCLFYALAQQDTQYNHRRLRQTLCQFYKQYSKMDHSIPFHEDSLYGKLAFMFMSDDNNDGETKATRSRAAKKITHTDIVCNDFEYTSVMDIIALAIILQRPIIMYQVRITKQKGEDLFEPHVFSDDSIEHNPPLRVLFNGRDHFEALILKPDEVEYISTHRPATKKKRKRSPTTKKTKKKDLFTEDANEVLCLDDDEED